MKVVNSILLMGGKNSRMNGNKKAFLIYNNEPFFMHIAKALSITEHLYISVEDKTLYTRLKEELDMTFTLVEDNLQDIGPIGGLKSVMENSNADAYLVMPCDIPKINSGISQDMLNKFYETNKNIVVCKDGKYEPLIALYKKDVYPIILNMIENKNYKIMNLVRSIDVEFLNIDNDDNCISNINTPIDFEHLT